MLPLPVLTGMVIWLVAAVLATSSQFVPNPVVRLLVCICTRQPVWSDGHESVRWFATIPIARLGAFVETTRMLPSTATLFCQTFPAINAGKFTVENPPAAWLNN